MPKTHRIRRRVLLWGGLLVLAAAIAFALRPRPVPVDLAPVSAGPMQVTVDEEGETRIRDRYVVSAPVTGRVLRIALEPGDPVVAGETVVARVQPSLPPLLDERTRAETEARLSAGQANVDRARAAREQAVVERDFAQSELTRQEELDKAGLVSQDRLEAARVNVRARGEALRAAESAVRSAEHELEVIQATLLDATASQESTLAPVVVRSPATGVVLRRVRESESFVPAGEPLVEIGNPQNLEIVCDLLSTDAVKIRPGSAVLIEGWGGDRTLQGMVRRVEPAGFTKVSALGVEEQRVNVLVDFADPAEAWSALGDGYRVEVRVVLWETDRTLKVANSSVFRSGRDGQEWAVYVVREGAVSVRPVTIGQRTGLESQILSGLEEGEQVILYPGDAVEEGVSVVER